MFVISETTDGKQFDMFINELMTIGRTFFKLFNVKNLKN